MAQKRQKQNLKKYKASDYELSEINKARIQAGMAPLIKTIRKCLKCDEEFEAYEKTSNFMCRECCCISEYDSFDS